VEGVKKHPLLGRSIEKLPLRGEPIRGGKEKTFTPSFPPGGASVGRGSTENRKGKRKAFSGSEKVPPNKQEKKPEHPGKEKWARGDHQVKARKRGKEWFLHRGLQILLYMHSRGGTKRKGGKRPLAVAEGNVNIAVHVRKNVFLFAEEGRQAGKGTSAYSKKLLLE